MSIRFEGPAVFVSDMAAARAFYEGRLDQDVLFAVGETYTAYGSGLTLWGAAAARQMIHGTPPAEAPGPQGRDNFELYFESEDLDAAWARMDGARAVHPVREAPWAQRCFRVLDPDGHIVEVGEPMPLVVRRLLADGLSAEEAAERTMVPLELVKSMAEG